MTTSQAGHNTSSLYRIPNPESSFFRALNAPFVATPFLKDEPTVPMPRVANPHVPQGQEPLDIRIYTPPGDWEWIDNHFFSDIHDLATLHDDALHTTTVRACRAGDRTLAYLNKSFKLDSRHPGLMAELWLYKHPLKNLMGECVPKLITVRSGPQKFNFAFELPHQTFFIEPSADMPDTLKRRTIKALERLHAKGVCHKALNLDDILIGADGNIYIYNFHHARYVTEQRVLQLREAKEIDFALELRRLKFKLDYQNAREKEKIRLGIAIERQRKNNIELRKQKKYRSYKPQLYNPGQQDKLTPPLTLPRFEAWVKDLDCEPRRFVMPGQMIEDFEWELKRFYNILQKMEDLDVAARLMQRPPRPGSPPPKSEPPTVDEEMAALLGNEMLVDSVVISNNQRASRKRKRSPDLEGSSSSPSKRRRREPTPYPTKEVEPNNAAQRFKHDELRPDVKLVSAFKVDPSVQENNVVAQWPIVVVRDFNKEPYPQIMGALKALRDKHAQGFKEEQEKARQKNHEEQSGSSWNLWNPLQFLFSSPKSDKGKERREEGQGFTAQAPRNPLRRHETLLYIDPPPVGNVPDWNNVGRSSPPLDVEPVVARYGFSTFHPVPTPLQSIGRFFNDLPRPF